MENTEKRKRFIINVLFWTLVLALVFAVFRYLIPLVMPFVISFAVAFLLKPVIKLLHEKLKFRWNLAAILLVILFYSTVGVVIVFAVIKLVAWLQTVVTLLPSFYTNTIAPALSAFFTNLQESILRLDPSLEQTLNEVGSQIISALGSALSNLSMQAVGALSGFAASVPGILVNVLIAIIATFFMAADYPKITAFILRQLPRRGAEMVLNIKRQVVAVVGQFLRSYCLIMLITFCELSVGFLIIGVENAFAIALLIAIFDILPVLGTGGVVIPWMIISFVLGNIGMGIGLLVIYLVVTVVRNIVEPKIIGHQVGLHPLVTLVSMFVGTKLFGFIGLFGLPITCAILKSLNDKGAIKLLK